MEEWMAAVSGTLRAVGARYQTCSADWLGAICVFVIVFDRTRLEELYCQEAAEREGLPVLGG